MKECHFILKASSPDELLRKQSDLFSGEYVDFSPVFKRYLLTGESQYAELPREAGAVSYIVQPPLDGSSIAVWIYAVEGVSPEYSNGVTVVRENGLEHIWSAGFVSPAGDSEVQTASVLSDYSSFLEGRGLTMEADCVRTWFFVHDIDHNYAGLVKARREAFEQMGLTSDTHYIASTGIAGKSPVPGALVQMDAYAVRGLEKCSQRYLYAPEFLNPTYEYGVTFERGVRFDFSGHRHVLISGTASIDNSGSVVHIGNVVAQTGRMFDNVEALLDEAGARFENVKQILVYLRNASDYRKVAPLFADKFPDTPYVITLAPVCRPDWLIEMECIALV